jgi:hypothetical protein
MPAVSVRKSLASPDHIISLIDGKPYKTLKRHLTSRGLTPEEYRQRYNLPANYPMVAPSFAAARKAIAEKIGLGSRRWNVAAPEAAADDSVHEMPGSSPEAPVAKKRGRPKAVSAATSDVPARKAKAPAKPKAKADSPVAGIDSSETRPAAPAAKPAKRPGRKPKSIGASEKAEEAPATAPSAGDPVPTKASGRRGKLGLFGKETGPGGTNNEAATPVPVVDAPAQEDKPPSAAAPRTPKRPRMARER